jgi:hypothetical protein
VLQLKAGADQIVEFDLARLVTKVGEKAQNCRSLAPLEMTKLKTALIEEHAS